ncbi:hypothetical protein PDIG_34630 [Penicillium digitatum PHI26]|uniref:Uncharacterized protein n=2 Tax=Penicillium digitatum TaxID=36651 RepID=K9GH57_PEND2|nr:hypothetical protein PDIP_54200 [Penicillium digitatum Pd1]EKV11938.1 hypothetical protein PDIP_54200 [Penicillium digitatum Pd1]EKV14083.1 hypothetical protein PDIG_34630 [Penicillium digitatum PHI26]
MDNVFSNGHGSLLMGTLRSPPLFQLSRAMKRMSAETWGRRSYNTGRTAKIGVCVV